MRYWDVRTPSASYYVGPIRSIEQDPAAAAAALGPASLSLHADGSLSNVVMRCDACATRGAAQALEAEEARDCWPELSGRVGRGLPCSDQYSEEGRVCLSWGDAVGASRPPVLWGAWWPRGSAMEQRSSQSKNGAASNTPSAGASRLPSLARCLCVVGWWLTVPRLGCLAVLAVCTTGSSPAAGGNNDGKLKATKCHLDAISAMEVRYVAAAPRPLW